MTGRHELHMSSRWSKRLCLHRFRYQFCHGGRHGLGCLAKDETNPRFSDLYRHCHLRWKRHRGVGPITGASDEQMAVSLGTIFVLNSIALLIFPPIGTALKLTQTQFGLWTALAIHDTSSVVGAAAKYGAVALAVGTTVKLARALWIVPMSIATALIKHARAKIQWPWFIGFFCLAAVCNTYLPAGAATYSVLSRMAKIGLTATLYLIGTGISLTTLKKVGHRPLLQGVILWLLISAGSLWLIRVGWIAVKIHIGCR